MWRVNKNNMTGGRRACGLHSMIIDSSKKKITHANVQKFGIAVPCQTTQLSDVKKSSIIQS